MSETPTVEERRPRPAGVAVALILAWLAAFGDIVVGVWLLIMSFDAGRFATAPVDVEYVRYWALVALLIGVLTALIASRLGATGSQFSRVLAVVIMALRLASAVWALIAIRFLTLWPAVADAALAILVIALLTTGAASDYFRRRAHIPSASARERPDADPAASGPDSGP